MKQLTTLISTIPRIQNTKFKDTGLISQGQCFLKIKTKKLELQKHPSKIFIK